MLVLCDADTFRFLWNLESSSSWITLLSDSTRGVLIRVTWWTPLWVLRVTSTNGFFSGTLSFPPEAESIRWFCLPCWCWDSDKRFRQGIFWPWTPYTLGADSFPLRKDSALECGTPSRELKWTDVVSLSYISFLTVGCSGINWYSWRVLEMP